MQVFRIWEGVLNGGAGDFVERVYVGELIGIWKPDGCEDGYFVYLLVDGRVVVYIHNERSANVYEYNTLDEAADAGFDEVLYLMDVKGSHKIIVEMWRKTFPYQRRIRKRGK